MSDSGRSDGVICHLPWWLKCQDTEEQGGCSAGGRKCAGEAGVVSRNRGGPLWRTWWGSGRTDWKVPSGGTGRARGLRTQSKPHGLRSLISGLDSLLRDTEQPGSLYWGRILRAFSFHSLRLCRSLCRSRPRENRRNKALQFHSSLGHFPGADCGVIWAWGG